MIDWKHILEREVIHFFSAGTVYLMAFFGWSALRKWKPYWTEAAVPALVAVFVIFLREPWDAVQEGAWWGKSYFDVATWLAGMALAMWGLYRFRKHSA